MASSKWLTREKALIGICALIVSMAGAYAVIKGVIQAADAACTNKICSVEMKMFDSLHAPLIKKIDATAETADKTYCLVKSQMTPDQVEEALRERDIDRGIRGPRGGGHR
jgi:hypothetical protein